MEFSGVLWDMDGTIVDTEPYWIEAEHRLTAQYGLPWSEEEGLKLVGNALSVSAQVFIDLGVPLEPLEIINRLTQDVIAQVQQRVPFRPGVRELFGQLRRVGIPSAMVTMSFRPLADAVVASLPEGTFDAVITGDEVEHGKPHPEPYEVGAKALGLRAQDCIAIEDSLNGALSASSAGARTLVVPCHIDIPDDPRWSIVHSLEGLSLEDFAKAATCRQSK